MWSINELSSDNMVGTMYPCFWYKVLPIMIYEFTWYLGLNTSLLINSHIAIMTINKSKDQKTSFKEAYMNLLLT